MITPALIRLPCATITGISMEQLPISRNLSLCDYHVFGQLKKDLSGRLFANNNQVSDAVKDWCLNHLKTHLAFMFRMYNTLFSNAVFTYQKTRSTLYTNKKDMLNNNSTQYNNQGSNNITNLIETYNFVVTIEIRIVENPTKLCFAHILLHILNI